MIFLIEYDREEGPIVTLRSFEDRAEAEQSRLDLELSLNATNDLDYEVVLLEAANEEAVRRTHRRYFEDLTELTTTPAH